jgi:Rrf2 family protein
MVVVLPRIQFVVTMTTNLTVSMTTTVRLRVWQDEPMPQPTNTRFAVAVHVLTYLAGVGGVGADARPIGSEEAAASARVNPAHVRKVMGPLRTAGLVRSRPGAGGGWVLCHPPERITLGEVWRVLQGDHPVLGVHGPRPDCPVGAGVQQALLQVERDAAKALERQLATVRVSDVLISAETAGLARD